MGTYNIKTDIEVDDPNHVPHHNQMGAAINDLDSRVTTLSGQTSTLSGQVSTLSTELGGKVDSDDSRLAKADSAIQPDDPAIAKANSSLQPEDVGSAASLDASTVATAVSSGAGLWIGTQSEYDAISEPDSNVAYIIREV